MQIKNRISKLKSTSGTNSLHFSQKYTLRVNYQLGGRWKLSSEFMDICSHDQEKVVQNVNLPDL